jgi:hypothetical protein
MRTKPMPLPPVSSLTAQASGALYMAPGNGGISAATFALVHEYERLDTTRAILRVYREDLADPPAERINVDQYLCVSSGGFVAYAKLPPPADHHRPDLPHDARPFVDPTSASGWRFGPR